MPRVAALILTLCLVLPSRAAAQSVSDGPASSMPVRLHVGLWTTHLRDLGRGMESNWLLGVGWRGAYGGTFVNSFGRRAFTAGVERPWVRRDDGVVGRGVGYRLGLVTGYDDRFLALAGKLPVLPMAQVVGDLAVGPSGVELAWAGLVASVGPYMRVGR